jgi:hypothetical protein
VHQLVNKNTDMFIIVVHAIYDIDVVHASYNIFHLWHGQVFEFLHLLCQNIFSDSGPLNVFVPSSL